MTMQSIEPLHTVKRASRLVERTAPCAFLEFMTAGKHPATLTDTIFSLSHRDLARRCSQCNGITEKQRYTCELKIVTGLPWESFQFAWSFHAPPLLPLASSLCAPGGSDCFMEYHAVGSNHALTFSSFFPRRLKVSAHVMRALQLV